MGLSEISGPTQVYVTTDQPPSFLWPPSLRLSPAVRRDVGSTVHSSLTPPLACRFPSGKPLTHLCSRILPQESAFRESERDSFRVRFKTGERRGKKIFLFQQRSEVKVKAPALDSGPGMYCYQPPLQQHMYCSQPAFHQVGVGQVGIHPGALSRLCGCCCVRCVCPSGCVCGWRGEDLRVLNLGQRSPRGGTMARGQRNNCLFLGALRTL